MDLEALRASARSKADEESTGFVNVESLDRFINEGNRFLYNKVVSAYEDYFDVEGTSSTNGLISVVSGTHKYALPSTLQKLTGVERRPSTSTTENDYLPLEKVDRKHRNRFAITGGAPSLYYPSGAYGYYSTGNYIYLVPVPTEDFTLRLWGVHRAVDMVATTDEPATPEEFHELIADFASMRVLGKSGEGIFQELKDVFELQLSTFLETIGHRDQEPKSMVISDPGCN